MLNLDFSRRVVIDTNQIDWIPSPSAGVLHKPLARSDEDAGHVTSIVQYEKGAILESLRIRASTMAMSLVTSCALAFCNRASTMANSIFP
ncbi:hypothetical protein C9I89_05260 [Photobacterium lipolyticum]|uniref:ChrR-like cupin domain-containing protein n=2 Tax=Photobacterium lipolyticum TaxID=266810 RepID=A0A2T3N3J2_9GAMM|nr:hypothetical protein C9I89_05260 [Photobacterium lipolyticum]